MNKNKILISQNLMIIVILYLSLIVGFFLNEDLAGGAQKDFGFHSIVLESFKDNYLSSDYSPFFFIFLKIIGLPFEDTAYLRFIFLHICLLVPIVFYQCLIEKFRECNRNILFFICLIPLISPHFRAYSIWAGDVNIALLFFLLSIYFFFKLKNEKNSNKVYYFIFLNVLCLALSAYFRPIYSLISIYFFYKIFIKFNFSKEFFLFIIFNLILSIPGIYYAFFMENFFNTVSEYGYNPAYLFLKPTLSLFCTNILLISTIFLFYASPFLLFNKNLFIKANNFFDIKKLSFFFLSIIITLFLIYNFNYLSPTNYIDGGGIFYKTSNIFFKNNFIFYFICLFSVSLLLKIINNNNINDILLILILIGLDPDPFIYHKTYDPLLFCIFILLFENSMFNCLTKRNQKDFAINQISFYIFALILYIFVRT